MPTLFHHLLCTPNQADLHKPAIIARDTGTTYQQLNTCAQQQAEALLGLQLQKQQRVAVYLPKQLETVSSFFAISLAGGLIVPINPVLKAPQVEHILLDCSVSILITSQPRMQSLAAILPSCLNLHTIILVENLLPHASPYLSQRILNWTDYLKHAQHQNLPTLIDTDSVAILYTSGSIGKAKGVVLSHRNLIGGAKSVSEYLSITPQDKLLAVLPLSFDYGLNQLTSALLNNACCVLLDYILPRDVIKTLVNQRITGLAGVPSLWAQLATLQWPDSINQHLRYMTNSGGKMPKTILAMLRKQVPDSQFFLMYGLTEAFRSTYLPPEQLDKYPDSIGKAIPNVDLMVVREDGSLCAPNEPGELVHRGSLVSLGYWNNPQATAERFRPSPQQNSALPLTDIAVWSGDKVTMNTEGYLFFIGRQDDMLKTSGYRVSPTEIEEVIYSSGLVREAVAIGIPHETLGQCIIAVVSCTTPEHFNETELVHYCKGQLANFMVPTRIFALTTLPKNANGKIDKRALIVQFSARDISTACTKDT